MYLLLRLPASDQSSTQRSAGYSTDDTPRDDIPANQKIGTTYELLEPIIVLLPPRSIFAFQRVNSTWLGVISRSENIKKQMGIIASGPATGPVDNRACLFHAAGRQLSRILYVYQQHRRRTSIGATPGAPIRARISAHHGLESRFEGHAGINVEILVTLKFSSIDGQGGSWRDVLLTNPPMKTVWLGINRNAAFRAGSYSKDVVSETGLTLGNIYEAHEDLRTEYFRDFGVHLGPEIVSGRFIIQQRDLGHCDKVSFATMDTDSTLRPGSCDCESNRMFQEFVGELDDNVEVVERG